MDASPHPHPPRPSPTSPLTPSTSSITPPPPPPSQRPTPSVRRDLSGLWSMAAMFNHEFVPNVIWSCEGQSVARFLIMRQRAVRSTAHCDRERKKEQKGAEEVS